jgi:D-alanyl-D-alanine carboxypeptidase (penicillin-binding protein 5/6)
MSTVVVGAGVALPSGAAAVPSEAAATSSGAAATSSGAAAAPAGSAAADVPCPIVKVNPPPPPPSPMPTHDPALPTIGGDGLSTTGLAVPPGTGALPTNLSATSWLVADLDSGEIIGTCAPHQYGAPASVQKLLLAETVMPRLKADQAVTITDEDLNFEKGSSAVGLIKGGTYTVETIWLGLFLNSGNDCANVLARLGGGDRGVAGTMADMNAEAKRLGALDTKADTPHGLDGPDQRTSVYDLALIFRANFGRENFRKYISTQTAMIPAQMGHPGYQIQNDNRMLFDYPGSLGGKTGFTDIARHTYVGAAERDGRRLVVTILGAERFPVRAYVQGEALLDWAFTVPKGESVGHLVQPGEADKVLAAAGHSPEPAPGQSTRAPALGAAAGPTNYTAMVGVVVIAVLFVLVWFGIALVMRARRRRAAG